LTPVLVAGPALAQTPPSTEATKSAVGAWELSNAERDRTCGVTLRGNVAPGGLALQWDAKCAALFPFTREVTAWTVGEREAMQLLDAKGKPVVELTEVEGGLYEGERPGEGILFLQSAGVAGGERTAEQMAGDWAVTRGAGRPICQLTLLNKPVPPESFSLLVKPGCDAMIARFAPVTWRLDRGQLLLAAQTGEPWRFEENEPNNWRRIPEGRQPLVLVKQ
jgi:hypothetical protein